MATENVQICSRCVFDTTVPYIQFDENGVCDYCHSWDKTDQENPNDERGAKYLEETVAKIKKDGKGKKYDCVIGVSGGTDSTYLMYWCKQVGLRPLAVQCDNGWATEISVRNIRNACNILDIDLYTHVLNWEEFKDLQAAFLRSSVEDADTPTDVAIRAVLYKAAAREGVKYFLVGNNFRAEGKVPIFWSYGDGRLIKDIQKKYGSVKLKDYPNLNLWDYFYYGIVKGIKQVRPFWYMKFNKEETKKFLEKELKWEYYGGHHYENIFTRFFQGYYLPHKFGFDKRKVEFSALIRSGSITREDALERLATVQYGKELMEQDKEYMRKKLGFGHEEWEQILNDKPRRFTEFKSDFTLLMKYQKLFEFLFKIIYPSKPQIFHYMDRLREENVLQND